ncbi:PH domain-containing protein [Streptomyces sp. HNM0574]|uniref:PH domain-containing protein n=1 Tax=Streptomyces sp. HNM0574 TaxID=2714954 RepID=UPI00146E6AE6|nr:PH domain-containing protein [Streptomyces sp. HNM0574]NLU66732.1 PH domain-containing protein [Streptomyces sp. HNM0574]
MTSEQPEQNENAHPAEPAQRPAYAERCYRSPAGMAGGVLLLALGVWLGVEAALTGSGRTPWIALAGLLFMAPLVVAYTLRPAVHAGDERLRVRNPFRTVTVPWGTVESVRSGYSSEVVADGTKYQLWAIPVSLRARKRAARHNERVASGRPPARGGGLFGLGGAPAVATPEDTEEKRAPSDRTIDELRELAEQHADSPPAQGHVTVRWAYEILGPAALGAAALVVLYVMR